MKLGRAAALAVSLLVLPAALTAQVGHRPESSPYRDLKARRVLSIGAGYVAGSKGSAGVGPADGPLAGIRLDLHLSGPAEFTLGFSGARLERLAIDPRRGVDDRVIETSQQTVLLVDAGFNLLFTGEKTWHRLLPYFGVTLGIAQGGSVPAADTLSTFRFSTQFHVGPQFGWRWYPSDRISFRVEAKDVLWRLKYPEIFFSDPELAPSDPPLLDPDTQGKSQWTHHPAITVTLGYAIRF